MNDFLITDVGSTTTKAILIGRTGGEYRLIARGEAPTTVEAPYEDVMIGVRQAIAALENVAGLRLAGADKLVDEQLEYYSTSSAGGGLQVLVIGLFSKITALSASKAALGAGAILLDVICADDSRPTFEKVEVLRRSRPDMILLAGGIDGGSSEFVLEYADMLNEAKPVPRFGKCVKLPVIYAGNKDARHYISDTLSEGFDLRLVNNLRPEFDVEDLAPARSEIHELFLHHVMQQAPGYSELTEQVAAPIMPTPRAVGEIMSALANDMSQDLLGIDIGGATTDVFSVLENEFHRTVSANMGMSYSACNVLMAVGVEKVRRWLPFEIEEAALENIIATKMLFPTTLPASMQELLIEQGLAREAIRLSLEHHQELIMTLPREYTTLQRMVNSQELNMASFRRVTTKVDMNRVGLVIGSGGALSHAPSRHQAALMLLDACPLLGVTRLAVDSIFMMPHLGALAQRYPEIALDVLKKDCFIQLGTAITASGKGEVGSFGLSVTGLLSGRPISLTILVGELAHYELPVGRNCELLLTPAAGIDIGQGPGVAHMVKVSGGEAGLFFDLRLEQKYQSVDRPKQVSDWLVKSGAYSPDMLRQAEREG